jgi:ribosomal protein L12E/L44/L45/RPP1/RPP2
MMGDTKRGIERGQSITFRVPSDTPDYLLKQLQRLKETERRNFSSKVAAFVLKGVNETFAKERETISIPLPKQLTKEQKSWLKHEHSEALIGSILYQLLNDPMRATSLLAALNSNSSNIDEALYLQEEMAMATSPSEPEPAPAAKNIEEPPIDHNDDDLGDLTMDGLDHTFSEQTEEKEEEEDANPLGDFFSRMNK